MYRGKYLAAGIICLMMLLFLESFPISAFTPQPYFSRLSLAEEFSQWETDCTKQKFGACPPAIVTVDDLPAEWRAAVTGAVNTWNNVNTPFWFSIETIEDSARGLDMSGLGIKLAVGEVRIVPSTLIPKARRDSEPAYTIPSVDPNNKITAAIVVINTEYQWSTKERPGRGQLDLQSIVTHELAHVAGLDHNLDPRSITFKYDVTQAGWVKRNLIDHDINALSTLYCCISPFPRPKTPSLKSPPNQSTTLVLQPSFDWPDSEGADGYFIQISKSRGFASSLVNIRVSKSLYIPNINLDLDPGATYFWHVKAYSVSGNSTWSPVGSFTVPSTAPSQLPDALVNAATLNVRTGPDTSYAKLNPVQQGDEVDVIGRNNHVCSWLQVITPTGEQGWISGSDQYVTRNVPCDSIPVISVSLPVDQPPAANNPTPPSAQLPTEGICGQFIMLDAPGGPWPLFIPHGSHEEVWLVDLIHYDIFQEGRYAIIRNPEFFAARDSIGRYSNVQGLVDYSNVELVPSCESTSPSPTAKLPSISFSAERITVSAGECTNLRWDVDNVKAVYLDNLGVGGHVTFKVCPTATKTFHLVVVHQDNNKEEHTVTIEVNATDAQVPIEPSISFSSDQNTLNEGECAILRWDVDNVNAVYLDKEGVSGHDSRKVCPDAAETYELTIERRDGGQETRSLSIQVNEITDHVGMTIEVSANQEWQDTGIPVQIGDQVQVTYLSGMWTIWKDVDPYTDANGQGGRTESCALLASANIGGLVVKVGSTSAQFMGNNGVFLAQGSGTVQISMNDCSEQFADNDGTITVEVTVAPAS